MKIFITGGTTGIGLELAKLYANRGDTVAICGRDLNKIPSDARALFQAKNVQCYQVDVGQREQVKEAVLAFVAKAQGLDCMVANAGRSVGAKTRKPDFQAAIDIMETNVLGVLYSFEAAMAEFDRAKKGHLVAVSSVAGFVGLPGAGAYSASKAAVLRLCESWSIDLKAENVDVTCICPGFIDTPLTQKNDHSMPFIMSAEMGAKLILRAIDRRCPLYVFPWQMRAVIALLDKMPRFLYRFLMGFKYINYSKQ